MIVHMVESSGTKYNQFTQHAKMKSDLCSEPSSTIYELCDLGHISWPVMSFICEIWLTQSCFNRHMSNTQEEISKEQPNKK